MTEYPSGKKQINWWVVAVVALLAIVLIAGAFKACHGQTISRPYHATTISTLASGKVAWTHIEVRGQVAYVRAEPDGDTHIKLVDAWAPAGSFIICECTPKEPCTKPRTGADIIVRGISRRDPEHGWWEIHPIESWRYATAGE